MAPDLFCPVLVDKDGVTYCTMKSLRIRLSGSVTRHIPVPATVRSFSFIFIPLQKTGTLCKEKRCFR